MEMGLITPPVGLNLFVVQGGYSATCRSPILSRARCPTCSCGGWWRCFPVWDPSCWQAFGESAGSMQTKNQDRGKARSSLQGVYSL